MTRSEFIENVQRWDDLMEIASDHDCEPLYDIYSKDELDEVVCNAIRDELNHSYWTDIRDWLSDIDVYEDYFRDNGCFDYVNLNDDGDFEEYKEEVLEWGDRNDIWDLEENDWVEEDDEGEEPESSDDDVWLPPWLAATYGVVGRCASFEPAPIADLIAML